MLSGDDEADVLRSNLKQSKSKEALELAGLLNPRARVPVVISAFHRNASPVSLEITVGGSSLQAEASGRING